MQLADRLCYSGLRLECPLCGGRFRRLAPHRWDGRRWHGVADRCPACGSLPRHRFLWLYLVATGSLSSSDRVLHVAPEAVLSSLVADRVRKYVSADLDAGRAMVQADVTALPFAEGSFTLVICSHVLEHVPDDRAAMHEIRRVLCDGGRALIQTPVNYDQAATFENPALDDPEERLRLFSQTDHVRVYGRDITARLGSAGFRVSLEDSEALGRAAVNRYCLMPRQGPLRNDLFSCTAE